jgi:hypothetical protein
VKRNGHGRIQGRAGQALRKTRLAREPLCRDCADNGLVTEATTPDHILPLAWGGTDTDDNIQCLCEECHARKTASEANSYAALNHPDWLEPSAIPLTIVSGPPASGKTTYLQENARPGDVVIDLDGIMRRLRPTYTHWSGGLNKTLFNRAIRERNTMLGRLKGESGKRAWFIVSAPTQAERNWWQSKLGGEIVLLHPGTEECKRRALERGTPQAVAGIDRWERASKQPWQAPQVRDAKPTIGVDGWPI